jgi:hypothetical protein
MSPGAGCPAITPSFDLLLFLLAAFRLVLVVPAALFRERGRSDRRERRSDRERDDSTSHHHTISL